MNFNERTVAAARDANLAVLTNAVELGSQVIMGVAGNAIANTVDSEPVTPAFLQEAIAARLQAAFTPSTGDR